MTVRLNELSRVDIYYQMPYTHLRFERTSDGFKGSYTIAFVLRDDAGTVVQTKEADRKIIVQTYDETVSLRSDFHFQSFLVPSGSYTVEMLATDHLSNLQYRQKKVFIAEDFASTAPSISSVLYLDTLIAENNGIALRPVLPSSLSILDESIGMFQEVYQLLPGDSIDIAVSYTRSSDQKSTVKDFGYLMPPYKISATEYCEPFDSLYYRHDSLVIATHQGSLQLFQFYPLPAIGGTHIVRHITIRRSGTEISKKYEENVFRRKKEYRTSLSYEEIIAAIRYIVREEEYDSLIAGAEHDRFRRIIRFWETHGGEERRLEFERRIKDANTIFTSCINGGQTAMGIVYIVCGMPDAVDCRASYNETWLYTIGDRVFTIPFRRENERTQNYELIPFSIRDNLWQYFVDRWRRK